MRMIIFMLFFGIAAGGIWTGISRSHIENGIVCYQLKSTLFFFAGIWFTISVIKLCLGEAKVTLPESFWDVGGRTYLHYGIVFAVIAVAAPLFMKLLFPLYGYHLVHIFDSIFVSACAGVLLLPGRVNNGTYCILYAVCILAGFGITILNYRDCPNSSERILYIGRTEAKAYILEALPFVGTWVVMTGIYFPNELYIRNLEEFTGNYMTFFLIMFFGSIAVAVLVILLLLLFVSKRLYQLVCLLIGGVCCAGYLQGMFLNGTLAVMNGTMQVWPTGMVILNGSIWIAILSVVVIGGGRKTILRKICKAVCIYISLIQLVTLGWLVMTSDLKRENSNAAITKDGSLELSSKTNVLVFVLDNFDSEWFETIYDKDGSILEPLADFTYYRNGTSQFAHTNPGIPYMLTGTEWRDDSGEDYLPYAYRNGSYLERIAAQGTDVRIYTELYLMADSFYRKLDNYRDTVSVKYNIGRTFRTMTRSSMYKVAPFVVKPLYEYYTSDIKEMTYNEDIWSIDNDKLFYDDIVEDRLSVSDEYGSVFRFYHMRGPHAPFYLTEDLEYESTGTMSSLESQGKGSLKIVYEYMEQMKALEIYDSATIIITADHGQGDILNTEKYSGQPEKTSRTIFLVKKPGEHHESMVINEAPVSQAELAPTILAAFGMEYGSYGRTFEEIPVDEKRVRQFVDDYLGHKVIYSIDGHAAELDSWSIKSAQYR